MGAEMSPEAENDLLAMHFGPTKEAIIRLLKGEDPTAVGTQLEVEIEDLPDQFGGWSMLRVGAYFIAYLVLNEKQLRDLGRDSKDDSGLRNTLIGWIKRAGDYTPFYLGLN